MPTIRTNMADINSSNQALNGLKIKTDALPNDWMVTLVNPKNGEPGENMKIARFIELLTGKQPVVTENSNGLFSSDLFKQFRGKVPYNPADDANTTLANFALLGGENFPKDDEFHYFIQMFYGNISSEANRIQIVYGYKTGLIHTRTCINKTFSVWNRFASSPISNYSLTPNALTQTVVEEVPVSANTPMTLQEDGLPVPTMRTVERYEYSIPKMAEMILSLREELDELKGGAGKE